MSTTLAPAHVTRPASLAAAPAECGPMVNPVVRWALYLFVFSIPFEMPQRSIPLETTTITAALFLLTTPLESRACYGRIPSALLWFGGWLWVFVIAALVGSQQYAQLALQLLAQLGELLLLCWAAGNLMRDRRVFRAALMTLVVACALWAALEIAGIGLTAKRVWSCGERETMLGQNANLSALILSAGVLAAVGLRHAGASRLLRLPFVFWPLVGLLGGAVVHTGSRGGVLALTAGLLVSALSGLTLWQRLRNGFAVLLAMAALVWGALHVEVMRNRFVEAAEGSLAGREQIYPVLLQMLIERPVLGWGPITNQFEIARRIHEKVRPRRDAHNLALEVVTTTGVVGAIPFFAGLWGCFLAARRGRAAFALFAEMMVGTNCCGLCSPSFWRAILPAPRPLAGSQYRSVHVDYLRGEQGFIKLPHRVAAIAALPAAQHPLQRGRDGFGTLVPAQLAPGDTPEPERDVAHRDGHDGEIARQRFLDDVGRAFLQGRENERIARVHVVGHIRIHHSPRHNQLGRQRLTQQLDRPPRQAVALARFVRPAGEEDEPLVKGQPEVTAGFSARN